LAGFSLQENQDKPGTSRMNILLVDDNEDYLEVVREILDAHGYTVLTALDGVQGCEVLASADIDLIISDIRMPRFDGLKLHAFARATEKYHQTKFIFITGLGDLYADKIVLEPGQDFLVDKRTSMADLLGLIESLFLGRKQEIVA
jgi:DNA-binding response OmpR family regulator